MDPVSIIGVLGSIVSIADVVTKSIHKLSDFKSRFRNAPLQVTTLIGQLYIIQAALGELKTWRSKDLWQNPRYGQLASQIDTSLECFCPLLLALEQQLNGFDLSSLSDMDTMKRISWIWNERDLGQYLNLIDRQVNALSLFLHAINCQSWTEQQKLVLDADNQTVLRLARDCSSSILGLHDGASLYTENTEAISLEFDFDALILGSRAYQMAHRSHLKQAIDATKQQSQPVEREISNLEDDAASVQFLIPKSIGNATEAKRSTQIHSTKGGFSSPLSSELTLEKLEGRSGPKLRDIAPRLALRSRSGISRLLQWNEWQPKRINNDKVSGKPVQDNLQHHPEFKLLLLGASDSGKSTLLKRMKLHFEGSYTEEDNHLFQQLIISNIVLSTKTILEAMQELGLNTTSTSAASAIEIISDQPTPAYYREGKLPTPVLYAIKDLWRDYGFLKCYEQRFKYQLDCNARMYAEDVLRLGRKNCVLTDEDILRIRVKTTGITETTFRNGEHSYTIRAFDMGGRRSERKKWVHCFHNTDVICFCVDVTDYAKVLFEDYTVNRMHEQVTLFDSLINSLWFTRTKFIILFTHMDQLDEILNLEPLYKWWEDFESKANETVSELRERYMQYLVNKFKSYAPTKEKSERIGIIRADLTQKNQHDLMEEIERMMVEDGKRLIAELADQEASQAVTDWYA